VSNSDLPGPYWQEQDEAGYGSGWRSGRARPPRAESPWDDGAGFWRDDDRGRGRDQGNGYSRPARHNGHRQADQSGSASGRPRRATPEGGWDSDRSGSRRRTAGSGRAAPADRGGDWTGRFSQTADDLRNRLGLRGSAASRGRGNGRPDDEFWGEQAQGRTVSGRTASNGTVSNRTGRLRAAGEAALAARSARRGAPRVDETGDLLPGGRTALRDHGDDFWSDEPPGRGPRSRIAERPGVRRGGAGGGRGGPGGGGRRGFDPRSRGDRFKDWLLEGSWWRHWTWKKALAVLGSGIVAVILLTIGAFFYLYERTPIPTAAEQTANYQSSTVYYANGKPMGTFDQTVDGTVVDRVLLTSGEIPSYMTEAMTAAEDRHFYSEGGVSLTGLFRSALEDIFGSGNEQGGSTITMQYAKNYYAGVDTGRNFSTKLKEIFIAEKLAHDYTKQWIMTNYLNTVPFGPTVDGLGAAAYNYFSVDLTKPHTTLTISQAAMLAAMPNAPGAFSPDPSAGLAYTNLVARWKYVLDNMVRDNNISQAVANEQKFPAYNPPAAGNGETGTTAYLMNMVEQQLEAPKADGGYGLTQQQVDTRGYRITTTFSPAKMNALARTVSQAKAEMQQDALQQGMSPFQKYDRIGAVVENAKTGGIVAIYGGPGWPTSTTKRAIKLCDQADCYLNTAEDAEQVGSSFKPYVLATAVKEGMSVFTSKLDGIEPIWIPEEPADNISTELTLSRTSPPPGVSAQAVGGYAANGVYWYKFAEAGEDYGPLNVNAAAAVSSDAAFEDLLHRTGVDPVISMAQALGVGQTAFVNPCGAAPNASVPQTIAACNDMTGPDYKFDHTWYKGNGLQVNFSPESRDLGNVNTPGSLQMALGQNPLTPVEQASTFATLSDDGLYHMPHVIASMTRNGIGVASPLPAPRQVLTQPQAADIDWALSWDNRYPGGTAVDSVTFRPGDVIGKTGTLGNGLDSSEAWFVGGLPDEESMAVSLFTALQTENLDNLPAINGSAGLYAGSYGGAWPATMWNDYMTRIYQNVPVIQLFQTSNFDFVPWIQVHANKAKPTCKPGQFQDCTCPKGAQFCLHPNPNPSCHGFGQLCSGNSPSPSPSCNFLGQCDSPTPTPTPSDTPSPGATCTPAPGQPCTGAADTTKATRVSRK
jgi:membrane peptidoglycan carboxypeptidase